MSQSYWIGRTVKTLNESVTIRGAVVRDNVQEVTVRYRTEWGFAEQSFNKNDVQFTD